MLSTVLMQSISDYKVCFYLQNTMTMCRKKKNVLTGNKDIILNCQRNKKQSFKFITLLLSNAKQSPLFVHKLYMDKHEFVRNYLNNHQPSYFYNCVVNGLKLKGTYTGLKKKRKNAVEKNKMCNLITPFMYS